VFYSVGMSTRTLLLSDIFPPKTGGSGRWFWEIYSRLPRQEYIVATGHDPRATEFDDTHDLKLFRLPLEMRTRGIKSFRNLKHYFNMARRVRKLVKREGITALHCARNLPEGFTAFLVKLWTGTKYLCYVHGEDIGVSATSRELTWLTRRVFAGASLVIANSNNTRNLLLKEWGLPEAKVRLLYPGVDTNKFVPVKADANVRRELGWTDRRVLLTVGRLQKRKGHDMLLRALPEIRHTHPNVLYAILGEGEERASLLALVNELKLRDHVQFLGEVHDNLLLQCYQQCDLFVLPNRQVGRDFEGFGMVLLEAQACGKPVIGGQSGGTSETMKLSTSGHVVPCETPEPLAKLLTELLSDPARMSAMGHAGREWVCEKFDWDSLSREAAIVFGSI
jgi:phosphatidylinositol alpha-1,6-mannosyltransferase